MSYRLSIIALLVLSCAEPKPGPSSPLPTTALTWNAPFSGHVLDAPEPVDAEVPPTTQEEELPSFIGGPCRSDSECMTGLECGHEDEGYIGGHCTQDCDLYCPDHDDHTLTFCPDIGDALGRCFSRCKDPEAEDERSRCREGYTCVPLPRLNEPSVVIDTCVPGAWLKDATACNDNRSLLQSDACFLEKASFEDSDLRDIVTKLLRGTATSAEAESYLDYSFALSQAFLVEHLGYMPFPNRSEGHRDGSPMEGVVVHYTANQHEDPTIAYFTSADPHASTHFMIGSHDNGRILQLYSHRDRTWHAGSSFNHSHFGIDFANAGFLEDNGTYWGDYLSRSYQMVLPTFGAEPIEVDDGIPSADDKYEAYAYWQPFTTHQLMAYVVVTRALHLTYDLNPDMVVRHGDISSSRVDPGPALPHSALKDLIFNREDVLAEEHWLQDYKWNAAWIIDHPEAR